MSTNLPEQPESNDPNLPSAIEPEDVEELADEEEPHDSGSIAFLLGVFGLLAGFCGVVSAISGNGSILFYVGGSLVFMAAFLAIQTIRGGSKRGRTAAIFTLVLVALPVSSVCRDLLYELFHIVKFALWN